MDRPSTPGGTGMVGGSSSREYRSPAGSSSASSIWRAASSA
ncbi:hypothetical protein [Micromonospora robiginosa]|uniref:Uncharacterized protein n=1 Tax=Micromonospora robiginosa TaxID=2749844 RepID=A0AAF0P423_9ACTN|nr:hypothetical protein [Micromonospora ferruginea]WMF04627.1 hypothetical protein H1D33_30410 [Micromonospora ferruginea]